ncbi:MAG: hypothetical protein IKK29_01880 [Christensenellaceae bacterium]|nr:hypothetical protein [Christensenellaceae bacterium]
MRKIMPHILIVISVVLIVFLIIDQVNGAMGFIDNQATKIIMMIHSALTLAFALWFGFNDR